MGCCHTGSGSPGSFRLPEVGIRGAEQPASHPNSISWRDVGWLWKPERQLCPERGIPQKGLWRAGSVRRVSWTTTERPRHSMLNTHLAASTPPEIVTSIASYGVISNTTPPLLAPPCWVVPYKCFCCLSRTTPPCGHMPSEPLNL